MTADSTLQERILVIKLSALGDFLVAMGAMEAIRKHHPKDHITLLTTRPFLDIAQRSGYFNEILIDRRPIDLSFFELRRIRNYYAADDNPKGLPYAVRYFGLLADTLFPLIVIALAVPFCVSGVRVNPAVGVSKSIGLFSLYYILMNAASSMATKHLVDPMVAAWLPNIGMSAIALWLFARLR